MRKQAQVFLVDPFAVIRRTVCEWLERAPGFHVCGQAEEANEALKAIDRLNPDVVVTEILDQKGLRFIHELRRRHPRLPILVYSFGDEMQFAPKALEAGADGFVIKGTKSEGLVEAISRTLEGRMVLSDGLRRRFLAKCLPNERKRLDREHVDREQSAKIKSRVSRD